WLLLWSCGASCANAGAARRPSAASAVIRVGLEGARAKPGVTSAPLIASRSSVCRIGFLLFSDSHPCRKSTGRVDRTLGKCESFPLACSCSSGCRNHEAAGAVMRATSRARTLAFADARAPSGRYEAWRTRALAKIGRRDAEAALERARECAA